jgi:hypothetical protein
MNEETIRNIFSTAVDEAVPGSGNLFLDLVTRGVRPAFSNYATRFSQQLRSGINNSLNDMMDAKRDFTRWYDNAQDTLPTERIRMAEHRASVREKLKNKEFYKDGVEPDQPPEMPPDEIELQDIAGRAR